MLSHNNVLEPKETPIGNFRSVPEADHVGVSGVLALEAQDPEEPHARHNAEVLIRDLMPVVAQGM